MAAEALSHLLQVVAEEVKVDSAIEKGVLMSSKDPQVEPQDGSASVKEDVEEDDVAGKSSDDGGYDVAECDPPEPTTVLGTTFVVH